MAKSPLFKKIVSLLRQASFKHATTQQLELDHSRRRLLASAWTTSMALWPTTQLLSSCAHLSDMAKTARSSEDPVVILGAGIAGLTAAYYLTQASVPCVVYEASSRIGGRMFTLKGFNREDMVCELGGELVDSNHEDLLSLCTHLDIAVDDFAPGDVGLVDSLYYFRKKYYTDKELLPLFKPFAARLKRDRQMLKDPQVARKMDRISLDAYLDRFTDVETWVVDLIRMAYVGEMGLDAAEQSCLGLIYMIETDVAKGFHIYGDSDESKKIRGGNISLVQKLENTLRTHGVEIHLQQPVLKLQELSSGLKITFGKDEATHEVLAKRTICTIPFSILRDIEGVSQLSLSPLKKKYIREVSYGTNSKLMIGYQKRIWRQGIQKGSRLIPASNGMVYSDLDVQNIWETSRIQIGSSGILTSFSGGYKGAQLMLDSLNSNIDLVNQIFPMTKNLHDGNHAMMNWSKMPYVRGSYSSASVGQMTEFADLQWTPERSDSLIFAGEHVADRFQGFMNGACRSGKKAAEWVIQNTSVKKSA
ncbi:MAG: FAD-dependent oxidoreductase [Bdellovibrionaceae bacterium]|nr:FAD-dependent oxidoreductase [Pseudobdellovibrionaceae bacterium]